MTAETAITSGLANLWLRIPWVLWLTLLVLLLVDRRKSVATSWIAISFTCAAVSLHNWSASSVSSNSMLWGTSSIAAVATAIIGIRYWLKGAEPLCPQLPYLLAFVGYLVLAYAAVQVMLHGTKIAGMQHTLAILHLLATQAGLAASLVASIELTFLSSPRVLSVSPPVRVRWPLVAWLALAALLAESVIGLIVMTASGWNGGGQSSTDGLLLHVFVLSLLVTHFVAWMIPHRIVGYQRRAVAAKASDDGKAPDAIGEWTSLTVAAWLVAISLAVVCALPSDWPWRVFSMN